MAPKSPVLFLLVFYLSLTGKGFGQKQSKAGKKDHYFGAYIGDFQDRFHGIAGQVKLKNMAMTLDGSQLSIRAGGKSCCDIASG